MISLVHDIDQWNLLIDSTTKDRNGQYPPSEDDFPVIVEYNEVYGVAEGGYGRYTWNVEFTTCDWLDLKYVE